MSLIEIPARHGKAARLRRGQTVRVVNTRGQQVVDTWAFRADDAKITISIPGERKALRDAVSGKVLEAMAVPAGAQNRRNGEPHAEFTAIVPPHSFRIFRVDSAVH